MKKVILYTLTLCLLLSSAALYADHSDTGKFEASSTKKGKLYVKIYPLPAGHATTDVKVSNFRWEKGKAVKEGDLDEETLTNSDKDHTFTDLPAGQDVLVTAISGSIRVSQRQITGFLGEPKRSGAFGGAQRSEAFRGAISPSGGGVSKGEETHNLWKT